MKRENKHYTIGFLIGIIIPIISFLLGSSPKIFGFPVIISIVLYGLLSFPIVYLSQYIIKAIKKSTNKKSSKIFLGIIISLTMFAFSSKLTKSITKIINPIKQIPTLLITIFFTVGPLLIFIYFNNLFIKKLSPNKFIIKTLKASSWVLPLLFIIDFLFIVPYFYILLTPPITTNFVLITSIIFIFETFQIKSES